VAGGTAVTSKFYEPRDNLHSTGGIIEVPGVGAFRQRAQAGNRFSETASRYELNGSF
jgi:hypothetical protein